LRALRYPAALIRDWLRGEINVRAMSLAYTTLLSLVPLMVFSFSILKGLGARGDLEVHPHEFFGPWATRRESELTESVMQFVATCAAICWARSAWHSSSIPSSPRFKRWKRASISCGGSIGRAASCAPLHRISERHDRRAHPARRRARPAGSRRTQSDLRCGSTGIAPLAWTLAFLGKLLPYAIVTIVFTFMYVFIPNTAVKFGRRSSAA
jgi:membrane protein